MIFNVKELKINVKNLQFDYITFGKGSKPLVLIQGLNTREIKGAGILLAYMYRIFAKDYKVYLFDRRTVVDKDITIRDISSDLATTMDLLGIANADVLGVSQGGMIAQYLAIERPDLVNKLVLAVTLSKNNNTVIRVVNKWIELAETGAMKELVTDMADKMYSSNYVKRYRLFMPLLTIIQKPKDIRRFTILAKACLTCNTYENLDKIKCPVFVIGGRQDKVVTGGASEEIANKIGCKIHIYESLGHAAYEEAKDFNKRVLDFFCE